MAPVGVPGDRRTREGGSSRGVGSVRGVFYITARAVNRSVEGRLWRSDVVPGLRHMETATPAQRSGSTRPKGVPATDDRRQRRLPTRSQRNAPFA